jgi:hypothetical protein
MKKLLAALILALLALGLSPVSYADGCECPKRPLSQKDGCTIVKRPLVKVADVQLADGATTSSPGCHCPEAPKRPLVKVADVTLEPADSKFDAKAAAQPFVGKIVMVAVLVDSSTGEVKGSIGPVNFPDMKTCNEVKNAELGRYLPPPPPGHRVFISCLNPNVTET